MTRKEEIQWEAGAIVNRMVQRGVSQDYDTYYQAFQDGARWADKTMIEKACEWLYVYYPTLERSKSAEDAWDKFKKAMEE